MHEKLVLQPKTSSLILVSYSYKYIKIHPQKRWGKVYVFAQILPGKKGPVWPVVTLKYFG